MEDDIDYGDSPYNSPGSDDDEVIARKIAEGERLYEEKTADSCSDSRHFLDRDQN